MEFDFVPAIKHLREMAAPQAKQPTVVSNSNGTYTLTMGQTGIIGLHDAKDFIEAVMRLGVRRYLADQSAALAVNSPESGTYKSPW